MDTKWTFQSTQHMYKCTNTDTGSKLQENDHLQHDNYNILLGRKSNKEHIESNIYKMISRYLSVKGEKLVMVSLPSYPGPVLCTVS